MPSKKISQFNISSTLNSGDLFTLVVNSTNKNITFTDFKSALGVTGTLNQVGDPLGVPVLDKESSETNNIRNLSSGAGIIHSINAQNGITTKWNVAQDLTGVSITSGLNNPQPVIASFVAGTGMDIVKVGDVITVTNTKAVTDDLANRVIVTQASDLSGTLDSTKEYFIDGIVPMASQEVEVPVGGLNISGYNFDLSRLTSNDASFTLFTSPVGGSGNVLIKDIAIEVTGAGSQVHDIVSATGLEAYEIDKVNFNDCTSLGTVDNYRQGLETGTGRFGGTPELTLKGTWLGGYFIDTSIVRSLSDGAYSLYKAGASFVMNSRFRSNQNIDLPASASFFDFAPSNFVNSSTLQITGAILTRGGVFDATDSNITPNISASDLVCLWKNNNGMTNTHAGGVAEISTRISTTFGVVDTFVDLLGTTTASDLQHFDSPASGQLRHLGTSPIDYTLLASYTIAGGANDELTVKFVKWDDSASSFSDVGNPALRVVNNAIGGVDVAYFIMTADVTLDENDFIKLQIANGDVGLADAAAELTSYFQVRERF